MLPQDWLVESLSALRQHLLCQVYSEDAVEAVTTQWTQISAGACSSAVQRKCCLVVRFVGTSRTQRQNSIQNATADKCSQQGQRPFLSVIPTCHLGGEEGCDPSGGHAMHQSKCLQPPPYSWASELPHLSVCFEAGCVSAFSHYSSWGRCGWLLRSIASQTSSGQPCLSPSWCKPEATRTARSAAGFTVLWRGPLWRS